MPEHVTLHWCTVTFPRRWCLPSGCCRVHLLKLKLKLFSWFVRFVWDKKNLAVFLNHLSACKIGQIPARWQFFFQLFLPFLPKCRAYSRRWRKEERLAEVEKSHNIQNPFLIHQIQTDFCMHFPSYVMYFRDWLTSNIEERTWRLVAQQPCFTLFVVGHQTCKCFSIYLH